MEAWIAQLEMEWEEESILHLCNINNGENELVEQLAAVLGEDFHYSNSSSSNTSSPTSFGDVPSISSINASGTVSNHHQIPHQQEVEEEEEEEETAAKRPKRKRQPNQVQDHIMAERKRRELLTQRFIALSALVPGLKKTDKTSVLGEAIKYLSKLKEKVKELEEMAAKHSVESVVVVKKTQLVVVENDEDGDNGSSSSFNNCNCNCNYNNDRNESLPQIEVKVSDKTFLFRLYCEKQRGILSKLFSDLERHGLAIVNTSIIPFGALALDITILAQMEMGFPNNVKEIIRSLHSTIVTTTS